jgi:hypothetical protein
MAVQRIKSAIFYLGLGLLFTHELDAMPNHEWRVLPVLRALSDSTGELVFVLAHVPIFAIVIAFVASLDRRVRRRSETLAAVFLVVHAVLHWLYSGHDAYEFSSPYSSVLIYAAALCGVLYFLLPAGRRP